ncbi:hypothetical protein Dda3937_03700 [Dickeya dadantii 3937]|uniref:Uncharacterized protein n=1 Tax=Dickeya dadantii (strain 3937) TaxID=198628 RepID=E0SN79_DICD3|nr:hypothetical protein Dda3937_03700 [Dickeya dadantii 3937]
MGVQPGRANKQSGGGCGHKTSPCEPIRRPRMRQDIALSGIFWLWATRLTLACCPDQSCYIRRGNQDKFFLRKCYFPDGKVVAVPL